MGAAAARSTFFDRASPVSSLFDRITRLSDSVDCGIVNIKLCA